uniref:Uncharacterized protein n=1 Tax=Meleagris gallopavo TaxID=9103 RepID=A0A803XT73_MELGA
GGLCCSSVLLGFFGPGWSESIFPITVGGYRSHNNQLLNHILGNFSPRIINKMKFLLILTRTAPCLPTLTLSPSRVTLQNCSGVGFPAQRRLWAHSSHLPRAQV